MPIPSRKREPLPGNYRPGDRITFAKDGPWPFDYGSDLHWLWGWGLRIHALLEKDIPASRFDWMIFRPDSHARDAMMRFSIKYPHVIKQVDDYLDFLEKKWTEFSDDAYNPTAPSAANFIENMRTLSERIGTACEVIADAEFGDTTIDNVTPTEANSEHLSTRSSNVNLSAAEQDIINVIREIGPDRKRTQAVIFNALSAAGKTPSEGTTKIALAAMVRHGILTRGYGLPEWGQ